MLDGRIIKGIGGLYSVDTKEGLFKCSIRGIFRKRKITPTIGDYVEISIEDEKENTGNIEVIKDRKNILIRPRVSNIDLVIIVFAAKNPTTNLDLLDRFIILAEEQNLDILICINKTDLTDYKDIEYLKELYENIGYDVLFTNTTENTNINILYEYIKNKVSVFAGPSGVGKSSIINLIIPESNKKMEIGELSLKIQRGKHTTRHAELIEVYENTYIVDSPGFTSITLDHIDIKKLQNYFIEFDKYKEKCKYSNCIHANEPDCEVKAQVGISIDEKRYQRYINFLEEIGTRRK